MVLHSFPARVNPAVAGPEEAKNLAGRNGFRLIRSVERRLSLELIALVSLGKEKSASGGYELYGLLITICLRRLAHFKLRRDFLDLRCLLCHRCQEGGHPGF